METEDPMFLALAVGAMPHKPPLWVIEACAALTEETAQFSATGNSQLKIGQRLDEMWRFIIAMPEERDADGMIVSIPMPSIAAAARHALALVDDCLPENPRFTSNIRHLERQWKAEQDAADPNGDEFLFDGLLPTVRAIRVLHEWYDDEAGIPYRHVSLQIARADRGAL